LRIRPFSYREVMRALRKLGFKIARQRGNHVVLKGLLKEKKRTVVVPRHTEIAVGTLRGILFQAGLTVEEFLKLIEET